MLIGERKLKKSKERGRQQREGWLGWAKEAQQGPRESRQVSSVGR